MLCSYVGQTTINSFCVRLLRLSYVSGNTFSACSLVHLVVSHSVGTLYTRRALTLSVGLKAVVILTGLFG